MVEASHVGIKGALDALGKEVSSLRVVVRSDEGSAELISNTHARRTGLEEESKQPNHGKTGVLDL